MSSRRSHTKSRLGCVGCKIRRVKCDEARPRCGRCTQRDAKCDYTGRFLAKHSLPDASILGNRTNELPLLFLNYISQPDAQTPPFYEQTTGLVLKDRDPELLHHYSTSTYPTLSNVESIREFWKIVVPQLAFSNDYLMHGLLSLSASHIAYQHPDAPEPWIGIARYHFTSAVSLYHPLLNHVTQENGAPLVAFSALLASLAIAIPQGSICRPSPVISPGDHVLDILHAIGLVRGVSMVMKCTWPWIKQSVVAPLFNMDLDIDTEPIEFDAEIAMRSLEARIRAEAETECLKVACLDAMKQYRRCYPRRELEESDIEKVLAWPALVSNDFFAALHEKHPIPMAILGLWGIILDTLRNVWWVGNKGQGLVAAISEVLPTGWDSLMRWAKMRVEPEDDLIILEAKHYNFDVLVNS